ncbi:MAG: GNAT family N-acetyltransferase [bacterium]
MDEIIYVPYDEEGDNEHLEDMGIDPEIALEDAESIIRHSKLGVNRGNDLTGVLVDTNKKEVVGTLWINQSLQDHEFSFDIAIHPNYRGRGLADKIIKGMIEEYKDRNSVYEDMYDKRLPIMITVINPLLINVLKRYGFRIDNQQGERTYMTHDTLRESPDGVRSKKPRVRTNFTDSDAITFGYLDNEMIIGDMGRRQTHDDITGDRFQYTREDFDYAGRLWVDKKVISLWQYPDNKETFIGIIKDLNKHPEINIDNSWFIEIPTAESWYHDDAESHLIQLKDFYLYDMSSIGDFKDKDKPHEVSDLEWRKKGGKKRTPYNTIYKHSKLPKDMTPAEYNYRKQVGVAESLIKIVNEEINKLL